MVTLLTVRLAAGGVYSCNASCHKSTRQPCACPCGGLYHGISEGTWAFTDAVRKHQAALLLALGIREEAGELWIAAYREDVDGPLVRRPRGKIRVHQEPLALYLGEDHKGGGRHGAR